MSYSPDEARAIIANKVENPVNYFPRDEKGGAFSLAPLGINASKYFGHRYEDVRIDDQEAAPSNPGLREVTASTYGQTIPVSIGKRRLSGNVIQSTQMVPRLVGGFDYEVSYQIPMYTLPLSITPAGYQNTNNPARPRPNPSSPPNNCGEDPCTPIPPDEGDDLMYGVCCMPTDHPLCFGCTGDFPYSDLGDAIAAADAAVAGGCVCAIVCGNDGSGSNYYQVCSGP